MAYTSSGGWSAWSDVQHHQNKLSLVYVNFSNRYQTTYDDTSIKKDDRFARIQLARYFNPDSKMKHVFYGLNIEQHWRKLLEDGNADEILKDHNWQLGAFFCLDQQPWSQKNGLNHFSIISWIGFKFKQEYYKEEPLFQNTGSVYKVQEPLQGAIGINISYTLFKKQQNIQIPFLDDG